MVKRLFTVLLIILSCSNTAFGALPQRIVSLAPALTEALYLLGVGERIQGCTIYCSKPEAAKQKEKVGNLVDFNLEKILTLKPDLVLAMEFADRRAIEKLKNLGLRVELFPSEKDFEHLCRSFLRLGKMVGRQQRALEIVSRARQEVEAVRLEVQGLERVKVFWQLGAKPLFTVTRDYFSHDYIEFAGGINIAADAGSGIYSREEVLKHNPDVIIIVTMGIATEQEKKTWQTYSTLNAVKNNRIYIVDSYSYCSPTPPGFVEALKELVGLLHPSIIEK